MNSIKNWAEDDRPREKLLSKGKNALSDSELLGIILRNGSKNESAVAIAQKILQSVGNNWNELAKLNLKDLTKFNGIGEAKAIEIIAVIEIGRRLRLQSATERIQIKSSRDVFEYFEPILGDLQVEEFWVLHLNASLKIIKSERISQGGITGTVVDKRMVFKSALENNSISIAVAHNHPSGSLVPSNADIVLTKELVSMGEIVGIKVSDHLIITQKNYYSFADNDRI